MTPEVTRDVCLLARMMAANMYYSQIEDLMFEVFNCFSDFSFCPFVRSFISIFIDFHSYIVVVYYVVIIILSFKLVFPLQLSMWRCSDELRVRADKLLRSSRRDAKHYIGNRSRYHSQIYFLGYKCIQNVSNLPFSTRVLETSSSK